MKRKVADIKFRDDLYPRIEKSPTTVQKYAEDLTVKYGELMPDVSPIGFSDFPCGHIRFGIFYPSGSVASHFYSKHIELQNASVLQQDVYFIRSSRGGPVKIGIAVDVGKRLESLQTAHAYPLEVIHVIVGGGRETERLFHLKFQHLRLNGEWFEFTSELEEVLR